MVESANKECLEQAIRLCRPAWIGAAAVSALMNLLLLTGPFFMLQVYDRVLTTQSVATLTVLALLAVTLYAIYGVFEWLRARLLVRIATAFDNKIANQALSASVELDATRHRVGHPTPSQDARTVQQFLSGPALSTLFDVPWFPIYVGVIFLLHPQLGAFAIVGATAIVIVAFLNRWFTKSANAQAASLAQTEDHILAATQRQSEAFTALGMLGNVRRLWLGSHDTYMQAQGKAVDQQAVFAAASKTLRLVLQSAILGFGAYLVIGNELSGGALIAASIIFGRALAPLDQTVAQWRTIAEAHASFNRLKGPLSAGSTELGITTLELPRERLSVNNLTVLSPDRESVLLENANFELVAGDALGVIGPSGGGKSSLVKGILGLLPTEGETRFDSATLDQWSEDKRSHILGYLPQEFELFPTTIAQNISRLAANPSGKSVLQAANCTGVHELVVSKPKGYDTVVGPGGHTLSGGERQRIALARAVYNQPFLVVLDEPNSNMDVEGERSLTQTVQRLRDEGSIVIVVTHRVAILNQTNKIIRIDGKQVTQFGEANDVLSNLRKSTERPIKPAESAVGAGGLRVVD